jgi:hypothetical protein
MKKFVLIDNDKLIRMSWEMAAKKSNSQLSVFSNADDFLKVADQYSKETYIYIDYELDDGKNGVEEAGRISALGFPLIYLATGYTGSDINLPKYILEIVGKRAPF